MDHVTKPGAMNPLARGWRHLSQAKPENCWSTKKGVSLQTKKVPFWWECHSHGDAERGRDEDENRGKFLACSKLARLSSAIGYQRTLQSICTIAMPNLDAHIGIPFVRDSVFLHHDGMKGTSLAKPVEGVTKAIKKHQICGVDDDCSKSMMPSFSLF